jgi:hypothetical protein
MQTGLRISEELSAEINKVAIECDLSKNNTMKMLIGLGLKAYNSITINCQSECVHTRSHNP